MSDTAKPGMSRTEVGEMIHEDLDAKLKELRELAAAQANKSRKLEDYALIVGIAQAGFYGFIEAIVYFLQSIDVIPVKGHPIPYMTIALFLGCILPKTVGRATAGKIWTGLGSAAADRLRGSK